MLSFLWQGTCAERERARGAGCAFIHRESEKNPSGKPSFRYTGFSEIADISQTALGLCAMIRIGGDTRKLGGGFRATGGPAYRLRRGPDHPRRRGSVL